MAADQLRLFGMDEEDEKVICEECGAEKDLPNGSLYCDDCKEF